MYTPFGDPPGPERRKWANSVSVARALAADLAVAGGAVAGGAVSSLDLKGGKGLGSRIGCVFLFEKGSSSHVDSKRGSTPPCNTLGGGKGGW